MTKFEGDVVLRFRTYYVKLKKDPAGGTSPVPLLTNSGPDMDLTVRRTHFATSDMWASALKLPKGHTKKKVRSYKGVF